MIVLLPLIIYIILMLISYKFIKTYDPTNVSNSTFSEFFYSFVAFLIMFLTRFTIDLLWQNSICRSTNMWTIIKNCIINSLYISIFTSFGYFIAIALEDNINVIPQNNMNVITMQHNTNRPGFMLSFNNHKNNLLLSILCYILIILYINPISTDKLISRNKIC